MSVRSCLLVLMSLLLPALPGLAQTPGPDPDFRPEFVAAEVSARAVRPGDPLAITFRFRNAGSRPAKGDYMVFLHIEAPKRSCEDLVVHADHAPTEPTSLWQPGEVVADGPMVVTMPTDQPEQEYYVHVGIYDMGGTGARLLDTYDAGTIRVTREAPPASQLGPKPLSATEVRKRAAALAGRIPASRRASLDTAFWRFDVDRKAAAWAITDKRTGVRWTSDPARPGFAQILLRNGDRTASWRIERFDAIEAGKDTLKLVTRPKVDGRPSGVTVTFTASRTSLRDEVKLSYASAATGDWHVARVRLLDNALTVTEAEGGKLYVPNRLGIELTAANGLPATEQWLTYDSLSMAMCGAVKGGSALLVNWQDVDTRLTVTTAWPDLPLVPGRRARSISLDLQGPRGACSLLPLGRGGYVEIARAYRPLAKAKGWLVTWAEKRRKWPNVDRFLGALDFKPFVFSRTVGSSRYSPDGKEHTSLGFTFDEAAQMAEHLKNDLKLDKASMVLAGWVNGGYDVRHPDPLPAAPECGGNAGLQDAARRIKACGYLFGLHDNYQDMYQDAPSYGLEWLNKDAHGVPKMGGNWAGGQAWQVCAIKQVELAARKDTNLPKIAELFGPTVYFIDTVFAWGLVTCEDPAHPMTRQQDLEWKSKLCLLAKKHFGLFGSEEGREWAVPCADYLEGIFGHQTDSAPGTVIPLLPLVYHDCVQIMTHQGNRIAPGQDKKVADHVLFAQMALPDFGTHLYWQTEDPQAAPITVLSPVVKALGGRHFEITYRWRVEKQPAFDGAVFVHFTHRASTHAEGIALQNDHTPSTPTSQWQPGTVVEDGPYALEVPETLSGPLAIRVGMLRGGERIALGDQPNEGGRYLLGTVEATDVGVRYEAVKGKPVGTLYSRGDGGWSANLGATDRNVKNLHEILSPLNALTADTPMTSHEFLTPDRLLQRARYGDTTVTVAYEKPAHVGDCVIPANGFVVEGPRFAAFCATRFGGIDYATPTLFTIRSLDGKPIAQSSKVRIYHGFGDKRVKIGGKVFQVEREAVVRVK